MKTNNNIFYSMTKENYFKRTRLNMFNNKKIQKKMQKEILSISSILWLFALSFMLGFLLGVNV